MSLYRIQFDYIYIVHYTYSKNTGKYEIWTLVKTENPNSVQNQHIGGDDIFASENCGTGGGKFIRVCTPDTE